MLTVISPAKRLEAAPRPLPEGIAATAPAFPADTAVLVETARGLAPADLRRLMDISPALAQLNADRFAAFGSQPADRVSSRYSRIASDWVRLTPSMSRVGTRPCGLRARLSAVRCSPATRSTGTRLYSSPRRFSAIRTR